MTRADPGQAREVVDRLESEIVDPDALGDAAGEQHDDVTGRVPGSPEPPD